MVQAVWNGVVIAESDRTVQVEGNHYFPRASVKAEYLVESSRKSTCPWKGVASYYSVSVDGQTNADAAWYYPSRQEQPPRSGITLRSGAASRWAKRSSS